jgi:hypothetical protein
MLVIAAAAPAGTAIDSIPLGRAKGIDYRSASVTFSGTPDTVVARCPAHKRLAGGAAGFTGSPGTGAAFILGAAPNYFAPGIPPSRAYAGSGSSNGQHELTAFATCTRHAGLRLVSHTRHGLSGLRRVKVRCPRGTSVTGGGVSAGLSDGIAESMPFDSGGDRGHAPDDGWTGRVSVKGSLTATAICTKKLDLAYRKATDHDTGSLSAVATCPAGTAVTGGGGKAPGGTGEGLDSLLLADIGDTNTTPEDGFLASGNATGAPKTLKAFAICKR